MEQDHNIQKGAQTHVQRMYMYGSGEHQVEIISFQLFVLALYLTNIFKTYSASPLLHLYLLYPLSTSAALKSIKEILEKVKKQNKHNK